jgi:hypothetical protein
VLPCCFWAFERKFEGNDPSLGQYATYMQYINAICSEVDLEVDTEALRIPSTKNLALISKPKPFVQHADDLGSLSDRRKEQLLATTRCALRRLSPSTFYGFMRLAVHRRDFVACSH